VSFKGQIQDLQLFYTTQTFACPSGVSRYPIQLLIAVPLRTPRTFATCWQNCDWKEDRCSLGRTVIVFPAQSGVLVGRALFFLSGMNPMTNSRTCTRQQSSVCTVNAKYVGRHAEVSYACRKYCITTGAGCVLTYCKLSAVKKSEYRLCFGSPAIVEHN